MKILGITGRKGAGKNTLSNFLHGYQLRSHDLIENFTIDDEGKLHVEYKDGDAKRAGYLDTERQDPQFALWAATGLWPYVKSYAFAHPLKEMCINLFNIPRECLYGTDEQKNTVMEHLLWENMPGVTTELTPQDPVDGKGAERLKEYYEKVLSGVIYHAPGPMTARQFMQFTGTEIFRKMYSPIWVNRCLNVIKEEESNLAIITDLRFDNEAQAILNEGGKVIQLTRGIEGDDHVSENGVSPNLVSAVLDNNVDLTEACQGLLNIIEGFGWIE